MGDWARSEVGLPASAIDNAVRRLDGSILRLLYSVAVHDGGDVVALVRRLLCNLFAGSDSRTTIDQLCVFIAAQRFPSWVVAKAAAAPAAVDEYGWLRPKNDVLAGKSSRQ